MKILHITNNYPTKKFPIFGIFVKEQIESLNNEGIESDIFFVNARENGKLEYLRSLSSLSKKLRNNYDILHCHHAFSAVLLLLTFSSNKFKKICSYQNPPEREGGLLLFKLIKFFFNGIILKNAKSKYDNVFYLPNGTNTDFFIEHNKIESKKKLSLDEKKNYIIFMDSYKKRAQKRVDKFDKVIELLVKNNNPYQIAPIKLTNTNRNFIPYYLSASSVHLITSDFEGSPNSVKECIACNTSVVSTPVGNIHDLIADVDGSYISKSFDCNELAQLVIKALKHKKVSSRKKLFEKKLDIKSVSSNLVKLYKLVYYE